MYCIWALKSYSMHIKITKSLILKPVNRNEYQNMDKNYCKLSRKMWLIIIHIQTNNYNF